MMTSPRNPNGARLLTSANRDSTVEHLVHVTRLQDVPTFLSPIGHPPPERSAGMLTKHMRRQQVIQEKILRENQKMWDQIVLETKNSQRIFDAHLEHIRNQPEPFAGSNIVSRTQEAKRIDKANRELAKKLERTLPRVVDREVLKKRQAEHEERLKHTTKFKVYPSFPSPSPPRRLPPPEQEPWGMILTSRAPKPPSAAAAVSGFMVKDTASATTEQIQLMREREACWEPLYLQDVKYINKEQDRRLRGEPEIEPMDPRKARTRLPNGWCDRDVAHSHYLNRLKTLQETETM